MSNPFSRPFNGPFSGAYQGGNILSGGGAASFVNPTYSSVIVLLNSTTSYSDDGPGARAMNSAGSVIDTTNTLFSLDTAGFDGVSDRVFTNAASADYNIGTSDFRIDTFARFTAKTGNTNHRTLVNSWDDPSTRCWEFMYNTTALAFRWTTDGSTIASQASDAFDPTLNEWYYLCVRRDGGEIHFHAANITQSDTVLTNLGSFSHSANIHAGSEIIRFGALRDPAWSEDYAGQMLQPRVVIGEGLDPAAPPTEAFPTS